MSKITLHPLNDKLAHFEYKHRQCLIMYYKGGVNIKNINTDFQTIGHHDFILFEGISGTASVSLKRADS
jgi:hypothetical protein